MTYKVKSKLREALKDEKQAPKDYMKLKKLLKGKSDKKVVQGIARQEREHYKKLKKIDRKY